MSDGDVIGNREICFREGIKGLALCLPRGATTQSEWHWRLTAAPRSASVGSEMCAILPQSMGGTQPLKEIRGTEDAAGPGVPEALDTGIAGKTFRKESL